MRTWVTSVYVPDPHPEGAELLLEPDAHPAVGPLQAGDPRRRNCGGLIRTDALKTEIERLRGLGVEMTMEPTELGNGESIAVVNDTCGNLIQLLGPS